MENIVDAGRALVAFTERKQSGNPRRAVWVIRAGSLEAEDKRSLFEDS